MLNYTEIVLFDTSARHGDSPPEPDGIKLLSGREKDLNRHLVDIRRALIDSIWKGMVVISLVGVPASLLRALSTGWLPLYWAHLALGSLILVLYLLRARVSERVRATVMVSMFMAVGLGGLATLGILGAGTWWLVLGTLLTSALFSLRAGIVAVLATAIAVGVTAWGYVSGVLQLPFDANDYVKSPLAWINVAVGAGLMPIVVFQAIAGWHRMTAGLLKEMDLLYRTLDQEFIITIAGSNGKILAVNDEMCRISGYSREELLGQDHKILNSGTHPKAFWIEMWRTVTSGQTWRREVCNRTKDGKLYWVDSLIAPVRGSNGKIEKYVSFRNDITARKLAEEEVARQARVISEQNQQLEAARQDTEREHALAGQVFERMMQRSAQVDDRIRISLSSLTVFGGDAVLVDRCPNGLVRILVADVSGHGLTAALGTLALSSIFYSSTERGEGFESTLQIMNRELMLGLPTNLFSGAVLIEVDRPNSKAVIANAGMPPVLVCQRTGVREIVSSNLPLGISKNVQLTSECVQLGAGDQIYAMSDGIAERANAERELFGNHRVRKTLEFTPSSQRFDRLLSSVVEFSKEQRDDFCLLEVTI